MRTEELLNEITEELAQNCGDFFAACRTAGVSPKFVRQWMKDDAKVKEAIDEAEHCGALGLESAAIKRAVHGVEEGVYYQGELVGTETKYSDSLLTTLLKGRIKSRYGSEGGTSVNVNVTNAIQAFPRPTNYAEWLQMVEQTEQHARLPAPDVEEAEYTPIPSPGKRLPPELDPNMADIL